MQGEFALTDIARKFKEMGSVLDLSQRMMYNGLLSYVTRDHRCDPERPPCPSH